MDAENKRSIDREIKLHKYLKHKNIIRHYGSRYHEPYNCQFIFMEYAEGGELFDRLCPDVGLPEKVAQGYFKQLICGVSFLHVKVIFLFFRPKFRFLTKISVFEKKIDFDQRFRFLTLFDQNFGF